MSQGAHHKATLRSLQLAGWKLIKQIDPALALGQLNVFIGANGAGKSNLVAFFRMLNAMVGAKLQEYIGTSGGAETLLHLGSKQTREIAATLEFDAEDGINRYFMRLMLAAADRLVFSEERLVFSEERLAFQRAGRDQWNENLLGAGHKESALGEEAEKERQESPKKGKKRIATVTRRLLTHCRVYHFHDTSETAKARTACYVEANRHLSPAAENLAAMLYLYRQTRPTVYSRIVATVRQVAPYFDDFILEPQRLNPRYILLNWRSRGSEYEFGPHQFSDGTLRAIAMATLLLQPEEDLPDLIVLDEPELGLHPNSLAILASLLKKASHYCQLIVATQSASLLDYFDLADIVVVEQKDLASSFHRPDPEKFKEWLEEYSVSELWEKKVIGGGPY